MSNSDRRPMDNFTDIPFVPSESEIVMPRHYTKRFLYGLVAAVAFSFVCSDAFTADWIDEDQPEFTQNEVAADDDASSLERDDLEDGFYPADDHEIAFDLEDDSESDLYEDETEVDPASFRPEDRDDERGDKKRADRKRGRKKRGDRRRGDNKRGEKRRGDRQQFDRQGGDRERGGAHSDCPYCKRGKSDCKRGKSDFPRHAFRDRGRHGPGHPPHGYGGPRPQDFQRGARMVMHRLTRLEYKVDMLLRMTYRTHVARARSGSADRGCPHCGRSSSDGERCQHCDRRGSHRDRDRGRRDGDKARDDGARRRHHHRRHHERDHDGPPKHRPPHRHHRPAEWDAPPQDSSDREIDERSAWLDRDNDEWSDDEWSDSYEEDRPMDGPRRNSLSVAESLERLERYFDEVLETSDE